MFSIISVPDDAADSYEQLGTRPKFWFRDHQSRECLFKETREGTGEDWSEKIASELCELLGLPHAEYELATWRRKQGVVTPKFVPSHGRLVLGNELLGRLVREYPSRRRYKVTQHTLKRVLGVIRQPAIKMPIAMDSFSGVEAGIDVFLGYLMLDAWIANQDRHHENWGLVVTAEGTVHLAPTYDHASSLGRNESDETRRDRLTTRDRGRSIERYVQRARSAFFASPSDTKPLTTLDVFRNAAGLYPAAAEAWLGRLQRVYIQQTRSLFDRIPEDRISTVAIDFAQKMLELNRDHLLRGIT